MRIITVTFHLADNYGALLQAYALQKLLLSKKINTMILNYDNKNISGSYSLLKSDSKKPIKAIKNFLYNILFLSVNIKKKNNFNKFRKNLQLTELFSDKKKVENIYKENDVFIVGSDQVWNPNWTGGVDEIYTLCFGNKKIKRLSYAASSGNVINVEKNINVFKERLNNFAFISVRENSLKEYLEKILNRPVEIALDPTMLLEKKDWIKIAGNKRIEKEKYIFTYEAGNPNQQYYDAVNKLAYLTGLKIVYFGKHDLRGKYECKKKSYYSAGPAEWLNLLFNAEYVVTTSFHGVALSSLLNKEMFVVLSTLPDRLTTLLNTLELNNRIINDKNKIDNLLNKKTEWDKVNKLIEQERKKSLNWLLNAIESDKNEQK